MIQEQQLKIVMVGHVDHGKSTFIGRLMNDTGSLPEGRLEQLQQAAARRGTPFEWANLMDALQAERDQNVTIDTAQIWFKTRRRRYVIIDAPGHKEFLKNMVTGAAGADAALLLIDALEGIQENTRRHGYLLSLLGISQVAVLVNKMDLANYSQKKFERIETEYREWLSNVGVLPKIFIPIAARHGENVATRSTNMPWWDGPTALEALDEFVAPGRRDGEPLRFPIQDVYRFDERRILAGRIEAGAIKVGDRLVFSPSNKISTVKTIERWNAPQTDAAQAGESIGITLTEQIFIERGTIAAPETSPPYELTKFKARLFWLGKRPLVKGRKYKLKLATQEVDCEIDDIERVIDASTLAAIARGRDGNFVGRHEVGELTIRTRKPVAFDAITEIVSTGRFVIVDDLDVCGGGVILDNDYPRHTHDPNRKSSDVYWSRGKVTPAQRELRNGQSGCVIWFTGLSGSGKSTIASELERELFNLGRHTCILDGDNIRHGLCSDLGFSPKERTENIRRVGEVARLFADTGIICITAFISPYRADRDLVRAIAQAGRFIEVFLNTPLEVCEQRDPKGLYARARAGELKDFTGISAPYEAPFKPEIELHTGSLSPAECVAIILERLKKLLPASP
ncbi:MAG TPA: adenylyl-sulfate kinase [Verrucomicrobiae bacterium]|jgi:bifunctional enzyme CysN/CysC|nr:adenylyl-sulfate kinase [Verrucomicrobiae bacterium]